MGVVKSLLGVAALAAVVLPSAAAEPLCLYVGSYHAGYHWNDGIEAGLERSLEGACELRRFYMDTKRNKGAPFAEAKALEAKAMIDRLRPDVVIACDDNASKYLVVPHLKGSELPVVFCGVNWTVEPYGYPFPNVTGMIEVAPVRPLLREASALVPEARRVAFVSADVPTQHKEVARLEKIAPKEGLTLEVHLAADPDGWRDAFQAAQTADIVVLGNPAGIAGWDHGEMGGFIRERTERLTVSFGVAMSRHAVFSMVNKPEEQGAWSGEAARLILAGSRPADLPITANRDWRKLANPELARRIGLRLPERILQGAERVGEGRAP